MSRWQQTPDDQRGTGRTMRMLNKAVLLSRVTKSKVLVVVSNVYEQKYTTTLLKDLGADLRHIEVKTFNEATSISLAEYEWCLWDHRAADQWESEKITRIIDLANTYRATGETSNE